MLNKYDDIDEIKLLLVDEYSIILIDKVKEKYNKIIKINYFTFEYANKLISQRKINQLISKPMSKIPIFAPKNSSLHISASCCQLYYGAKAV